MTEALLGESKSTTSAEAVTTTEEALASKLYPSETKAETPVEPTTPESKPAETPKVEEKAKTEPAKADPAKKAPDRYEWQNPKGMPEDFEQDSAVFDSLGEVARELDLSQADAQKIVDKVLPVMHRRTEEQHAAIAQQWRETVENDAEIGRSNLKASAAEIDRAKKAYGTPGLDQLLSGPIGNHPELVRFFVKVGRSVSEDKFVGGERRGSLDLNDDASIAAKFYPKTLTQMPGV